MKVVRSTPDMRNIASRLAFRTAEAIRSDWNPSCPPKDPCRAVCVVAYVPVPDDTGRRVITVSHEGSCRTAGNCLSASSSVQGSRETVDLAKHSGHSHRAGNVHCPIVEIYDFQSTCALREVPLHSKAASGSIRAAAVASRCNHSAVYGARICCGPNERQVSDGWHVASDPKSLQRVVVRVAVGKLAELYVGIEIAPLYERARRTQVPRVAICERPCPCWGWIAIRDAVIVVHRNGEASAPGAIRKSKHVAADQPQLSGPV